MKTFGNLNFGTVSIVNAGQRQTSVEPQLIFTSTPGGIRITPPVSKFLGIQHGDYVMFINTVAMVDAAINEAIMNPSNADIAVIINFCEANGLDINDPATRMALHKEFDEWYIAKGIQEYDSKGNVKTIKERLSKEDKLNYVKSNLAELKQSVLGSNNEELIATITRPDITEEELINALMSVVSGQTVPSFAGSKCANAAKMMGVGTTLNFTDSAVWSTIKSDLGADASKKNRIYNINLEQAEKIEVNNGFENITITVLPFIGTECAPAVDENPIVREKKAAHVDETASEE